MKRFQKLILAVAALTLVFLLWRIDPKAVWGHLAQVGWGMALILAQEIVAQWLNTIGWRYAFVRQSCKAYSFWELLKLRIVGDGVNYLTPSATIAGEFIRATSLDDSQSAEVRYGSVVVAKFTQSLAQALFVLLGLFFVIATASPVARGYPQLVRGCALTLLAVLGVLSAVGVAAWKRLFPKDAPGEPAAGRDRFSGWLTAMGDIPRQCLGFCVYDTRRFAASTGFFMLGYAWGAFEAYWICRFLGIQATIQTAMVIEALSNLIDGMTFIVPAKVGTQEAGKTIIFLGLGLPASAGFAFGVVRHIREVIWAAAGLLLGALSKAVRTGGRIPITPCATAPGVPSR